MDLVQWLSVQLDEDEKAVRDRLCVNCGNGVEPLSSPLGTTGYTHEGLRLNDQGEFEYGWEGRRCPGMITGAEPVQNPARALREIDAKRKLIARGGPFCTSDCGEPGNEPKNPDTDWTTPLEHHLDCAAYDAAKVLAVVYPDRPGYRTEWAPAE